MHYFDPNVAAVHGIEGAILINHFQHWIKVNMRNENNFREGRTWTYTTAKALKQWLPYFSEKRIWNQINKLVEEGVLMKGNFNKTAYDRTTWYAFTLESFWIRPEGDFHFPKQENGTTQRAQPIPDGLTDKGPDSTPAPSGAGANGPTKKPAGGQKKKTPGAAPDTDWQRWVDRWDKHFKDRHEGMAPMLNGVQLGPSGLKGIRKHLVAVCVKIEGKSDDDCGFLAWDYILTHWDDMKDDFLCSQFDLTVILKKINDILNRLKNGGRKTTDGTGGRGAGTSHDRNTAVANY